jgi:peroxiredoxin
MLDQIVNRLPVQVRVALKERLYPHTLQEGENAPEWSLQGHDDAWHHHADHWSLMVFYPGDGTAGCTKQLREIEEYRTRLEAVGCKPFGVNPADVASHKAFAEREGLNFPLLVDTGHALTRQYHALFELPMSEPRIIRTVYLVNPARKIRLANRGAPSVAAILRSIQALQQATRAGM